MNATGMINLLQLYVQVPGISLQSNVADVFRVLLSAARETEGVAPEIGRGLQVIRLTIDNESCEAAAMHGFLLPYVKRYKLPGTR
jgi:hypothetical protein